MLNYLIEEIKKEKIVENLMINSEELFTNTIIEEFENIKKNNQKNQEKAKDTVKRNDPNITKMRFNAKYKETNNMFESAKYTIPGLIYDKDNDISRIFQTVAANYNILKNYNYSPLNKISEDNLTTLTYQSLVKLLFLFKFLEKYRIFLYKLEKLEDTKKDTRFIINREQGLFKELLERAENHNIKKILKKSINTLKYFDKNKINKGNSGYYVRKNYMTKQEFINPNVKNIDLLNDIRNFFVHSEISASSGSGNPIPLFLLSNKISNIYIKEAEDLFTTKVLSFFI